MKFFAKIDPFASFASQTAYNCDKNYFEILVRYVRLTFCVILSVI